MLKFKWSILCFILVFSASADALKCASEFNTASSSRKWMSFDEAKALMQKVRLTSFTKFEEWKQNGNRPKDFPSNPERTYKNEWVSWGDFLGTGNISTKKRKWKSFDEAKAFIQSQGVKTRQEFIEWKKAGKRPKDFPSNPQNIYNNQWVGWSDFLGTENTSTRKREKREWMSFDQAKTFIQRQGIRTSIEFQKWKKAGKRPKDFPSNPNTIYKEEWKGWRDFLGTGNISTRKRKKREWMSFDEAKIFIQRQGIKTHKQFQKWKQAGKRPEHFPSTPEQTYKDKWKGWGDFLGTGNISTGRKKEWMSFDQAQALMQSQGIKTSTEFIEWKQAGKRPENFPSNPERTYKKEWVSWSDFLGIENISTENSEQTSLEEITASLQRQEISTHIKPENVSNSPDKSYKDEQTDLDSFLESEKEYMTYEEAKTFVQQLRITNLKDFFEEMKNNSDVFPENFPPNPKAFYTNTGEWIGWNDFLGLTIKSDNKINHSREDFQIEENNTLTQSRVTRTRIKPKKKKQIRNRLKNIPSRSEQTDKDEHTNQSDPLGTGNTSTDSNGQTSFEKIKAFLQRQKSRASIEPEEEEQNE